MAKKRGINRILLSTLVSLFILLISIWACRKAILFSYNYTFNIIEGETTREASTNISKMKITVTEDTTLDDIATTLHKKGFITNLKYFKIEAKLAHLDSDFIPGEYDLSSNMSSTEMLKRLTTSLKGQDETIKFTIPEGYSIAQIAETLEEKGIVSQDDFLEAVSTKNYDNDFSFLKNIPYSNDYKYRLEGYLFPDTYVVNKDTSAEEIIIMMLSRFEEIISKYSSQVSTSSYNLHELTTIASIIEQEAKLDEERPIISGVIYNRLNDGMRLQMCSTIQYILNKRKTNLSQNDLAKDSPYNTYLYDGLPIGPICCPGEACIKAAASPAEHNYYFFVIDDAEIGSHYFSGTNEEHIQAKVRYKQNNDINFED